MGMDNGVGIDCGVGGVGGGGQRGKNWDNYNRIIIKKSKGILPVFKKPDKSRIIPRVL